MRRRAGLRPLPGARVATGARSSRRALGLNHAEHVTRHPPEPAASSAASPSIRPTRRRPEMQAFQAELDHWLREETGYSAIQGTKPQTLAYGADRLAGRSGRLDRRKIPHLERQRRRRRAQLHPRRAADQHHAVLGDRRHRQLVLALLRAPARGLAAARAERRVEVPDGIRSRFRATSCIRRARWPSRPSNIQRWTVAAARRALRGPRRARAAGRGRARLCPNPAYVTARRTKKNPGGTRLAHATNATSDSGRKKVEA